MDLIRDLSHYEAWADAEHWRALMACREALEDAQIRERLLHIHGVQRWYLTAMGGPPVDREELSRPFESIAGMAESFRRYHEELSRQLEPLTDGDYQRIVHLPWFSTARPALAESLMQVFLHSQYHRGQNATRLREVGGNPPSSDYIIWLTKGRPAPVWP